MVECMMDLQLLLRDLLVVSLHVLKCTRLEAMEVVVQPSHGLRLPIKEPHLAALQGPSGHGHAPDAVHHPRCPAAADSPEPIVDRPLQPP
jgi:hypothetical protein